MTQQLIPSMQNLVYWSSVHTAADADMDSMRAAYDALCRNYTPPRPDGIDVVEDEFAHDNGTLRYRLYSPKNRPSHHQSMPLIYYIHGGGFVVGGLDSHEVVAIPLALRLNATVMIVDYRLAPEHPYPAALEDVRAGWQYIVQNANDHGIDVTKMVLAGDSAGGTLAAILAQETKHDDVKPVAQVLIYPALTMVESVPSHSSHANAPLLSVQDLQWYYSAYVPDKSQWRLPSVSPLSATDFTGLPPTFIAVASIDPLADESMLYRDRLRQANVPVEVYMGEGLLHGSIRAWKHSDEASQMLDAIVNATLNFLQHTHS